jgi:hypothetical protein
VLHGVSCRCQQEQLLGGRTLVLRLAGHFAEELDEVGQVVAEEFGFEHQVLAGVPGIEASSQQLGFADYAQC